MALSTNEEYFVRVPAFFFFWPFTQLLFFLWLILLIVEA